MSSIIQSVMNQVCVRMGSNKIQINVPRHQATLTCSQVIEIALERCKLDKSLVRTYAIFESVCGIERKLHRSENFILVCRQSSESQEKTQFIIRKYLSSEKRVCNKLTATNSEHRKQMIRKCYKKMNSNVAVETNMLSPNVQKRFDSFEQKNESHLAITTADDMISAKSTNVKSVDVESKISNNTNFLQCLYAKLKKQNVSYASSIHHYHQRNASYERLMENDSCGESSGDDECSNGSHRSTSSLKQ